MHNVNDHINIFGRTGGIGIFKDGLEKWWMVSGDRLTFTSGDNEKQ